PSMLYALDTNMIDYQLGRTFLNIPLSFIPRVVWQNKPTGLGEDALLGRLFLGENYWALPPGEYGVAYLNFSLIGLIALPILVGYISAILYNSYKKLIESDKISLYTITYPFIFLNIFSFFTIYSFMGILFKIILIVFFYSLSTIQIKKRN